MSVRASVVITAHNASQTLGRCLDSLEHQDQWGPSALEVIVIDDRSTDGTFALALKGRSEVVTAFRLTSYLDRTLTARQVALDKGICRANAEVVLLLDADARVATDWSATMATPVLSGRADLVAGGVAFDATSDTTMGRILSALQTVDAAYYLFVCRILNALGAPSGILFGNAALGTKLYERVEGFHGVGHSLTEDLAFARATKAAGGRIAFVPRARVRVDACVTLRALVQRAVRTSAGGASVLATALGTWMLMLVASLIAAVTLGGGWWELLALRYITGVLVTTVAVGLSGEYRRIPYSLVYEPIAIVLSICALIAVRRARDIEWGGIRYDRHRRRAATA